MQYWISHSKRYFDTAFGGSDNEYEVDMVNLALNEGDICIIIDYFDKTIIGEKRVYKVCSGWAVLEVNFYLFPIPLSKIFTEDELQNFDIEVTYKITENTYNLLKGCETLSYYENIGIQPSKIANLRQYRYNRLQRIQEAKDIISQLQSRESQRIMECTGDDYLIVEPAKEPPIEIKYFLPNHGEKRRQRRKPRP